MGRWAGKDSVDVIAATALLPSGPVGRSIAARTVHVNGEALLTPLFATGSRVGAVAAVEAGFRLASLDYACWQ